MFPFAPDLFQVVPITPRSEQPSIGSLPASSPRSEDRGEEAGSDDLHQGEEDDRVSTGTEYETEAVVLSAPTPNPLSPRKNPSSSSSTSRRQDPRHGSPVASPRTPPPAEEAYDVGEWRTFLTETCSLESAPWEYTDPIADTLAEELSCGVCLDVVGRGGAQLFGCCSFQVCGACLDQLTAQAVAEEKTRCCPVCVGVGK